MTITKLVESVKNEGLDLEKVLDINKYVPFEVKKTIAQAIIYECTNEEFGVVKMDSVQKYLSYIRHMITAHTNLEYTDEDYDTLCAVEYYNNATLLNAIIECFSNDAKECSKILDFMMDDYMRDVSIEAGVAKFLNSMNKFIETINDKQKDIEIPDSIDMNKLSTFLQNYIK